MKKYLFIAIIILSVLSSCDFFIPNKYKPKERQDTDYFNQEVFDYNRQMWLEHDIKNYVFTQEQGAVNYRSIPPREGTIYVKNDFPVYLIRDNFEIDLIDEENDYYYKNYFHYGRTISEIYEWMEKTIEMTKNPHYNIEVKYNNEYHYPEYFHCLRDKNYSVSVSISEFNIDPQIPE